MNGLSAQVAFYSVALLTLSGALYVVTQRNIIHAGFGLLPTFVGVAGLYAVLEAHFFVVVQILIYVGAIQVLMLFALMLTRSPQGKDRSQTNHLAWPAAIICSVTAIGASWLLVSHPWPAAAPAPADAHAQTVALGQALIGPYALPFEVASLLLLAALVGAVVLAKGERERAPEPPPLAEALVDFTGIERPRPDIPEPVEAR